MRILMFYHSLLSDWNHGNAHFLRGVATELTSRGHEVVVYEPRNAWSLKNLVEQHGLEPIRQFHMRYPLLSSRRYNQGELNLDAVLKGADMVIVHEWSDQALVRDIGRHRASNGGYRLYFHDTHHRMVTQPESMAAYELSNYDGVLAYGKVLQQLYQITGCVKRAWTWHEAADTRVFKPVAAAKTGDLVWVGNWGDDERTCELREFLFEPSRALGLRTSIHGVRYSDEAKDELRRARIDYLDWLPNFQVPEVFAANRLTVHIPRRPYVEALPGIPTIRPFEAMACGIPLISSPWEDSEGLFRPGKDFLIARDGREMKRYMRDVLHDRDLNASLIESGLETIRKRHTCVHRVDELLSIDASVKESARQPAETARLSITEETVEQIR